jgi:nucleoside-diphosphate-sugar epimerase
MSVFHRDNIYGFSKVIGEELCEFYFSVHGVRAIILRPADFTPYHNRKQYGERLLRGGVDRRDVYQAAALAVEAPGIGCAAFPVMRGDPWTAQEIALWEHDPLAVLEHYVPEARRLMSSYDLQLPKAISVPDISTTRSTLGYRPEYNFVSFLHELAVHDVAGDVAEWLREA